MAERKVDCNEVLEKVLKSKKLDYTTKDGDKYKIHTFTQWVKNKSDLKIKIRTTAGGDAKMWSYLVTGVPGRRRGEVLEALNAQMCQYRFVAFYLDGDDDVVADYDFGLYGGEADVEACIRETYILFVDIVNKCLPDIMKAVWHENPGGEMEILRMNPFGNEED